VPRRRSTAKLQSEKAFTRLRPASHFSSALRKQPKTPCAGRAPVRLVPHRFAALLGNRRPAPNSHIHVFGRCATALALLATPLLRRCGLVRSNSGAYSLRLPAMLAALNGALSHLARASMHCMLAFSFHPLAIWLCRIRAWRRLIRPTFRCCSSASFASFASFADPMLFMLFPWSRGPVVPWSRGPEQPHFIVGMLNSAPARMPVGQRAVMVFIRV